MLRIASWNVENLVPWLAPGRLADAHRELGSPAVLCLQEIRVRPQDIPHAEAMRAALPGFDCHVSLNRDAYNGRHRGGRAYGVATWTDRALQAAPLGFAWDCEGRAVASVVPAARLAIVNVYAVNGTSRPYRDPQTGAVRGDRHAFKRRFVQQLAAEVEALLARGMRMVLVGDWNISRTRLDTWPRLRSEAPHALARAQFNDVFLPRLRVYDVFRDLHPATRAYTWFSRRARDGRLDAARVDFALVDEALRAAVVAAGICDFAPWHSHSDHAPLWLDLHAPALA